MKKTYIIAIVVFVLLVGTGLIVKFFFDARSSTGGDVQPAGAVGLPGAQNAVPTVTSGGTPRLVFNLFSVDGGTLSANNFLAYPDTYRDPVNAGYYSLGYPVNQTTEASTSTPPYLVMYIAATQFFTVELLQEPIGEARLQVELHLQQRLGLSPNDLCKLNYTLSVPVSVNKEYAGKNLGFSFCPGATVLPK